MPTSDQQSSYQQKFPPLEEVPKTPPVNTAWIGFILLFAIVTVLGGFVVLVRVNTKPPQYFVPPTEPSPSPTAMITQIPPTVPVSLLPTSTSPVVIPLISTDGWKQVGNDGVSFLIPPQAWCVESETQCSRVQYTWELNGRPVTSTIYVDVQMYNGGSRRAQFLETNEEILNCNPIYVESLFGKVSALQIGSDGGMCQGGGGGIVTVVGDKFVSLYGLSYNSETKVIPRFAVRDTIISTLR